VHREEAKGKAKRQLATLRDRTGKIKRMGQTDVLKREKRMYSISTPLPLLQPPHPLQANVRVSVRDGFVSSRVQPGGKGEDRRQTSEIE